VPRLVIIASLTPLAVGDAFTLREWPLHVTVAPTFVIVGGLPAVLSAASPILLAQRALTLCVGPEEGFGKAMNVPVSLIEVTAELTRLHDGLVTALLAAGAQFDDPEFVGAGYRPHITLKGVAPLQPGAGLTLQQAAVVDMAPAGERRIREVVWTTELG
jgi:2'-5' RNA ligase superfamily